MFTRGCLQVSLLLLWVLGAGSRASFLGGGKCMSGDRINQRRVDLTPELRRLRIQTRQDYTASGRTRQAARSNENHRRSRSQGGLVLVPVSRLVSGEEFESPLLTSTRPSREDLNLSIVEGPDDPVAARLEAAALLLDHNPADEDPEDLDSGDENGEIAVRNLAMADFNFKSVDGLIPTFDGRVTDLDRFIRGVELAFRLTLPVHHPLLLEVVLVKLAGRAQVLAQEGRVYANWGELRTALKHRFKTPRPTKAVRKALEALYQKPSQSVRDFALEVEDLLAEFLVSDPDATDEQRAALAVDREAQALEVFVDGLQDKLRDWAKARDFATLQAAVDFAMSEEHNVRTKVTHRFPEPTERAPVPEPARTSQPNRSNQGRGGPPVRNHGRGPLVCYVCGVPGHMARNCPRGAQGSQPVRDFSQKCEFCKNPGHNMAECRIRKSREEQRNEPNGPGATYAATNQPGPSGSKNGGSSSASPANVRSIQASMSAQPSWGQVVCDTVSPQSQTE